MDLDLRNVGLPCLPDDVNRADGKRLIPSAMVLQLVEAIDISQPKRFQGDSSQRMLRLKLTDGVSSCVAVEYESLQSIKSKDLVPGVKILLHSPLIRNGIVLLEPKSIDYLGGRVSELAEAWEVQQLFGGTQNRQGLIDNSDAAERPPLFEHYQSHKHKRAKEQRKPKIKPAVRETEQGKKGLPTKASSAGDLQTSQINSPIADSSQANAMNSAALNGDQTHPKLGRQDAPLRREIEVPLQGVERKTDQLGSHTAARAKLKEKMGKDTLLLFERKKEQSQHRGGKGRRGHRGGRMDSNADEKMLLTLEEWEMKQGPAAQSKALNHSSISGIESKGLCSQSLEAIFDDEKLAWQLQRDLNLEAEFGRATSSKSRMEDDIKACLFDTNRPIDSNQMLERRRHRVHRGRGRGKTKKTNR